MLLVDSDHALVEGGGRSGGFGRKGLILGLAKMRLAKMRPDGGSAGLISPDKTIWQAASILALALAQPALAQPAGPAGADTVTAAEVYPAEFFARFAPRTAVDMLTQVPGFDIRNAAEEERGLGQASTNVLVNGQRLSGKSEDTLTQLGRIPASNVVRIEIVDAATLEVPGLSGQVANIFVKSAGLSGNFAYRLEARPHFADPMFGRFDLSLNGKAGRVEYTLGLSNLAGRSGAGGPTRIEHADGSLIERRDDALKSNFDQPKASVALKIDGPGSSVANFNASYRRVYFDFLNDDLRTRPGGVASARALREQERAYNYEIGGDFEFKLGPGRLKLIGLDRFRHSQYQQQSIFTFANGAAPSGDKFAQLAESAEKIARAEYGWKLGGADWQLSGEAAFNKLDNVAALFTLGAGGTFVDVPFPGGSGGVKEDRYESILSYSRPLGSKLSLQLSGGAEFSRLSLTGSNANSRAFWRPKGALSLAWIPQKGLDISFKAKRRVGQLNFGDFLAKVFLDNDNQNAGNGELVPPQSWEFELEAKKTLGQWGTTTLRLFDYRIEDLVDIVPVGMNGESLGNIDQAHRQGIVWNSTFQLAPLGLKGAKLDANLTFERSRVKDPLTGLTRPISETQDRAIELEFRHDIPKSNWAYGFYFNHYHFRDYYRLSEVGLAWEGPNWAGLFVENKDVLGLTVRASVNNLLNARNRLDRTVYDGFRDRSLIAFVEHRNRLIGPIFNLLIKGNF